MTTKGRNSSPIGNVLARSTTSQPAGKIEHISDVDLAEYLAYSVFGGAVYSEGDFYCYTGKHWEAIPRHEVDNAVASLNGCEYLLKEGKKERVSLSNGRSRGS